MDIIFKSEDYLDTEPFVDTLSPGSKSTTGGYQNSLIEQLVQQQQEQQAELQNFSRIDNLQLSPAPPKVPGHFIQDKLNLTNSLVRSKMDSINHEISELDIRMQNIQLVKLDKRKPPPQLPHIPAPPESDTEHIYETIPESMDSELEPIYSCPYEMDGDDNMIEHWLKNHQDHDIDVDDDWLQQMKEHKQFKEHKDNNKITKSKSSKSNSSGEEHENSSSAYNTGGSCNSNPLTFELASSQDSKHKDMYRYCRTYLNISLQLNKIVIL